MSNETDPTLHAEYTKDDPDPVVPKATAYAVAKTDPLEPKHPWVYRFAVVIMSVLFVLGTFSAILGAVNSSKIAQQSDISKHEQDCLNLLLRNFVYEQQARAAIAADDRSAINTLVDKVAHAKTNEDVTLAFKLFHYQTKLNNIRRARYPLPEINEDICSSAKAK